MSTSWAWAAARAAGSSHLAQGLPCQDSYACKIGSDNTGRNILVAALADGAGSAEKAEVGAALATALTTDIVCETYADGEAGKSAEEILRQAISEAKRAIALAADHHGRPPNDYACTLIACILTPDAGVVAQIGDGAAVIQDAANLWRPVHWPDHGEYANTTNFLTEVDALETLRVMTFSQPVRRFAMFSDGLERLVLDFRTRCAHAPFFDGIFSRLSAEAGYDAVYSHDLAGLLTSDKVNARTDDDKSLFCAALTWG